MRATRVSAKGWIVIPKDLRDRYGISEGSLVSFTDLGDVLSITPVPEDPVQAGFGLLKGARLTETLLEDRKQDRGREDRA